MDNQIISASEFFAKKEGNNKYRAVRCWSELCGRDFDSKVERERGEQLYMMNEAGEIRSLEYQPMWVLCWKPKITYTADFRYYLDNAPYQIVEDVKGMLTRETRVKLAWLKEKGIQVLLYPRDLPEIQKILEGK